ncbi:hypothetical protein Gasu2_44490 [Galdieria sulphuraria]|nr:hypothetical protein Gasu2_44490 [Galdieria sulphuraria]
MAKAVRIGAEGYKLKLDGAVQEIDGSMKEKAKLLDAKFLRKYYEENKDFFFLSTREEKKMFVTLQLAREYAELVDDQFLRGFFEKALESAQKAF